MIYPTDLTNNQWQFIQKTLLFNDRKRKYDLKEVWSGIFYLVKTGCQWRMLPEEYPRWKLVYYYFRKWSFYEEFDLLLSGLRESIRLKHKQNKEASLGVLDSQSVKWGNKKAANNIDGNKKFKGIKRHVVVNKNGLLKGFSPIKGRWVIERILLGLIMTEGFVETMKSHLMRLNKSLKYLL